jgi:hypothetical protein
MVACFAVALLLIHILASWMEREGWIHYRHGSGSLNTLGNAALSVQQILEPEKRYVLEARRDDSAERDHKGGA